jgi:transposase
MVLILPAYSPDLNPIGMAFSKIKVLLRKAYARTYDQLWKSLGEICELFSSQEYQNDFKACSYEFITQ